MQEPQPNLIAGAFAALFFIWFGAHYFFFVTEQERARGEALRAKGGAWSQLRLLTVQDNLIMNRIVGVFAMLVGAGLGWLMLYQAFLK